MRNKLLLYEGNAKQIYATNNPSEVIIYYTDEVIAFNGIKKAIIASKGIINNRISGIIYQYLKRVNVPNHFIKFVDERQQLCHHVEVIPIEVIIRNIITGSIVKRLNVKDKVIPKVDIYELCYKDDKLHNPLINDYHVLALDLCSAEELKTLYHYAKLINESLKSYFDQVSLILVDLKLEFGRTADGSIILADEITPDTCRLWDKETEESLDKDRFRQDLGNVIEGYTEVLKRLESYDKKSRNT